MPFFASYSNIPEFYCMRLEDANKDFLSFCLLSLLCSNIHRTHGKKGSYSVLQLAMTFLRDETVSSASTDLDDNPTSTYSVVSPLESTVT